STCPSANSSKDCPTSRVVWQPTLSPTYLAMCAYVEYIMGERNVAKRIGVVLSIPILNFSNQQETLYVSPLHVLPAQDATPSRVSIYLPKQSFPKLLPLHARSGALRHSKYQCSRLRCPGLLGQNRPSQTACIKMARGRSATPPRH